jgi:outer membrane protein assembly factor BamB
MHFLARTFFICALLAPTALATDWGQWRGPNRDGHVPEDIPVPANLDAVKTLWHVPAGNGLASPVVAGGKCVYVDNVNSKETVHAVDAASGDSIWSVELDEVHKDSQSTPGPRCTPMIDGDRVYAQSGRGHLKVLNLANGNLIWQTDYVKDLGAVFIGEKGSAEGATRHGYTASPIVDGDHLIAETGGSNAAVTCFEKRTGQILWKSQQGIPGYAAPILATVAGKRQLICYMVPGVFAFDPVDGKLLWTFKITTKFGRHAATPVVVGDTVVVSSHEVGLMGIKVTNAGDNFSAEKAWLVKDLAINFASPVAVGDYVYGVGPQKNLICVQAKTGNLVWSKDGFFTGNAGKTYAGMLLMGSNLLVLTDDGRLVMVAADSKAYHEIGHARVGTQNWCIPAYADGKLYLRDEKEVVCVQLMP